MVIEMTKEKEYDSIKEMVKNLTPEQLRELQKAYNDYLRKQGIDPIPFM